jgi:AbrB family looped-hinge helix DNA binding protein
MSTSRLVKVNSKGQIVIPREIREKMGIKAEEKVVIFIRGEETVIMTPQKYSEYTSGMLKGAWGSSEDEIMDYLNRERNSWK